MPNNVGCVRFNQQTHQTNASKFPLSCLSSWLQLTKAGKGQSPFSFGLNVALASLANQSHPLRGGFLRLKWLKQWSVVLLRMPCHLKNSLVGPHPKNLRWDCCKWSCGLSTWYFTAATFSFIGNLLRWIFSLKELDQSFEERYILPTTPASRSMSTKASNADGQNKLLFSYLVKQNVSERFL